MLYRILLFFVKSQHESPIGIHLIQTPNLSLPLYPLVTISLFSMSVSLVLFCESEIHSVVSDYLQPQGVYSPWNSSGQSTGVGSLSLLQGLFPTQGSNPGLLHYRRILYQLSHKVQIPKPSNSSRTRELLVHIY